MRGPSKKPIPARKLGKAELVLAYELRSEGYRRNLIARALGCTVWYLDHRLAQCEREGISWITQ
jgi:hypothetical protein